jgi:cytochrome c oxidase subunit III
MDLAQPHDANKYYIPTLSPWPIVGAIALFTMMLGAICYLNEFTAAWSLLPGAALITFMFVGWFSKVIDESQHGTFNTQVGRSFRMGMMWFIFS